MNKKLNKHKLQMTGFNEAFGLIGWLYFFKAILGNIFFLIDGLMNDVLNDIFYD